MRQTVEQMCRDLLTIAIEDTLMGQGFDPQGMPSSDLTSMANHLTDLLREQASGDELREPRRENLDETRPARRPEESQGPSP